MRASLGLALLLFGCRSQPEGSGPGTAWAPGLSKVPATASARAAASATPPREPRRPAFAGTTAKTERVRTTGVARLTAVRTGRHDEGYVRVVFEFAPGGLPGYRVQYVEPPVRRCGRGDPTAVAGAAQLEVSMSPADAHDERGAPTVEGRERQLTLGALRELELTCDFEAETTWVIGVEARSPYRVLELADPPRLAVDILE